MAGKKAEMQKLIEERDRLARQIEALQNELKGINRAITLLTGESTRDAAPPAGVGRTRNVKDTVIDLIANAGPKGLSVNQVLEAAKARNISLERGTVSSLLSRLKREMTLDMTDGSYFIRSQTGPETRTTFQ